MAQKMVRIKISSGRKFIKGEIYSIFNFTCRENGEASQTGSWLSCLEYGRILTSINGKKLI
jgi:hypothetical protein